MTKPWHHSQILCYCFIVLYLLLLDKYISDNSKDSIYKLTSLVVTSQLVINLESNIHSPPTLFVPPQEIQRQPITAARAQHQSWSHVFPFCSVRHCADTTPSTSDLWHTPTLLCLHSANLWPLTTSDLPLTSDAVAPTLDIIINLNSIVFRFYLFWRH